MKKIIPIFILAFFITSCLFAQTKKIALQSHSGKKSEFIIDGDGNFGNPPSNFNPILQAEMHRYADSIRKVDSMKNVGRRNDSIRKSDSVKKANPQQSHPKKSPHKKAKGINAAASFTKPKKQMVVSKS
jgi:hypothetical protein